MNIYFKNFVKFLFVGFIALSCSEYEAGMNYDGSAVLHFTERQADKVILSSGTPSKEVSIIYGTAVPVTSSHTVNLVFDATKSTLVLGVDFVMVKSTDQIENGETKGDFVVKILQAGLLNNTAPVKKAVFTLSSSSLGNAVFSKEYTLTAELNCPSALAGTYQYSTVNYYSPDVPPVVPGPKTGTVTFGATAKAGEYTISDASFGGYSLYGPGEIATGVKLVDACGKLSFVGANQYGDTHTISNVVVNGNKLTFRWDTTYGEYGTTTLTKPTGNWPALTN